MCTSGRRTEKLGGNKWSKPLCRSNCKESKVKFKGKFACCHSYLSQILKTLNSPAIFNNVLEDTTLYRGEKTNRILCHIVPLINNPWRCTTIQGLFLILANSFVKFAKKKSNMTDLYMFLVYSWTFIDIFLTALLIINPCSLTNKVQMIKK